MMFYFFLLFWECRNIFLNIALCHWQYFVLFNKVADLEYAIYSTQFYISSKNMEKDKCETLFSTPAFL